MNVKILLKVSVFRTLSTFEYQRLNKIYRLITLGGKILLVNIVLNSDSNFFRSLLEIFCILFTSIVISKFDFNSKCFMIQNNLLV